MKVSNVEVMGLDSSIKASKYPMAIFSYSFFERCSSSIYFNINLLNT